MDKLSFLLSIFLIEIIVDVFVLKVFKIYYRKIYLLFLQTPKVCANVLSLFYFDVFWISFVLKLVSMFLCVLFLTDKFNFKRLVGLLFLEIVFLMSICGFLVFVLKWINCSFYSIFSQNIAKKYQIYIIFSIFLYIFAVFKLSRFIDKNRFLRKFLTNVSFCFCGKHINLYGLIDSGNMLYDFLTKKPIVLVSIDSLKKYFLENEIEEILKSNYRKIRCDTISGSGYEIPIFKVENFLIKDGNDCRQILCMLGLVSYRFEKGKIDCLLHRDFL